MFIAMNRFRIRKDSLEQFLDVWRHRERRLDGMEGFLSFRLLHGPEAEDHVLIASHTCWQKREHFTAWTESEAFRASHRPSPGMAKAVLGRPDFEGFDVVMEEASDPRADGLGASLPAPRS